MGGDILILDAMGVLYQAGDDVAELLVPFVHRHGTPGLSAAEIDRAYLAASLGEIGATEFWTRMGVDPALEDDYLAGHKLLDGTLETLPRLKAHFGGVACLSNDIADWSKKLRTRFGLEAWIDAWFISGDFGMRKQSPEIYRQVLAILNAEASDIVFVDDRPANLDVAKALGIRTVLLDVRGAMPAHPHRKIRRLAELLQALN